ncbi:MAG: hypothetical protein HOC41_05650 [Candidatus Marinimicrobia bacterium]|jgi:hypothetical protein|nr:hypothetical protein [Candidatus Neomarinimicrobiota bacterium]
MKWLLLGMIIYFVYKSAGPFFSIFKINQSMKVKQRKTDIRTKIKKMDIQDAEFEEEKNE